MPPSDSGVGQAAAGMDNNALPSRYSGPGPARPGARPY